MQAAAPTEPKFRTVLVTPDLARRWLERNPGNRRVDPARVATYAAAMQRGAWLANGETVKFSPKGDLLDGQHRLHAVCKAGVSVRIAVAEGVSELARLTLDAGKPRTIADRFRMNGVGERAQVAAAAVVVIAHATLDRPRLDGDEAWAMYYDHLEGFEWAAGAVRARVLMLSPVYAGLVVAYPRMPQATAELADKVRSGANLEPREPALTLLNHLRTAHVAATTEARLDTFFKTLRAVQAHAGGERIARLYGKREILAVFGRGN